MAPANTPLYVESPSFSKHFITQYYFRVTRKRVSRQRNKYVFTYTPSTIFDLVICTCDMANNKSRKYSGGERPRARTFRRMYFKLVWVMRRQIYTRI